MNREQYLDSMHELVDNYIDRLDELCQNEEIRKSVDRLNPDIRNGRSFRDIALDDALYLFENVMRGTRMQDPPYGMYTKLFTERWGHSRKVERHGIERFEYIVDDTSGNPRPPAPGFPQIHLALETIADQSDLVAKVMNTMFWPYVREIEHITFDDMQLRSVAQHNEAREQVRKAITTLNTKMKEVKANLTVITKPAEPEVIGIVHSPESVGNWRSTIDQMVGMRGVKDTIGRREIDANAQSAEQFFGFNSEAEESFLNSVIIGPPGVGKTTVARLMGKVEKEAGRLSKGHVVEVGRADLCGEYIGHTAPKTRKAFESARGGILFIDEAYSLVSEGRDYGSEALTELVRLMSIHKDTAVYFAGYPDEIGKLMEMNPGIARRTPKSNYIHIPEMSPTELMEVANRTVFRMKAHFSDAAKGAFGKMVAEVKELEGRNFGNAGMVNELVAAVKSEHNRICQENGVMERVAEIASKRLETQQMIPLPEDLVTAWRTIDTLAVQRTHARVTQDFFNKEGGRRPIGFGFSRNMPEPANQHEKVAVPAPLPLAAQM